MQAPASVIDLVKKFERNLHSYKSGIYNETQVRVEFINPFFEALGWDVYNKSGCSEQYKDVIHEFSLKTQEYSNAPDYLFKVGTMKKFFVEAKKPIIYIKEDIHPAYQLRRYAWSAKLPLSILTDFEEFAVYDCRLKPNQKDKASVARRLYYTFREYPDMWGEIHSKFSREAVLQGEYDKFAEGGTRVKGTEVDDAFLREIEGWRDSLARNIALRNSRLSGGELNYSVQKIIDRIIFLRICEGRGIEEFKELHNLSGKTDIYKHLLNLFRNADKKYNSGLFHFTKEKDITEDIDNITPVLSIDDKIFKDIIESLYYPKSPYEFSVFGAEILGHVYEQFLGKVIRLTAGHQAKVEEKPEVKKAGGVYYTPAYIVDYIVKNTLGKKLEEIEGRGEGKVKKIIEEAGKLRVLDPACGSGSFLLGAYQYLLDWHIKIYQSHEKEFKEKVYRSGKEMDTDLHLTTKEKKRILLNNIYGVDIDSQAVEVSKLSLLLKVLEGETDETLAKQLDIFTERALPDLSRNIKCGNSLIDTDYYDNETLFEQETSVNPFNWQKGFPEIFKNGGFDVVIGNPPYVSTKELSHDQKEYFITHFISSSGQFDLYMLFIELSIRILCPKGIFGMITSNTYLSNKDMIKLRQLLLHNTSINKLINLGETVFENARIDVSIIIFEKVFQQKNQIQIFKNRNEFDSNKSFIIPQNKWNRTDSNFEFLININLNENNLINKLFSRGIPISEYMIFPRGIEFGSNSEKISKMAQKHYDKLLVGKNIKRYAIEFNNLYIKFENDKSIFKNIEIYKQPKLLIQRIRNLSLKIRIVATLDTEGYLCTNTLRIGLLKKDDYSLHTLLGIINSNLINWLFLKKFLNKDIYAYQLEQIPLPDLSKNQIALFNDVGALVADVLSLYKGLRGKTLQSEYSQIQTKIDYCEDRINKIVYELYGLTEEEIKIVEGV